MRIATSLLISLFAFPLALVACGDDKTDEGENEPFDTLQECYDDHHSGDESLPVLQAIVVCCLEHPIDGERPSCGTSQSECVGHVDLALDNSVTTSDIDAACANYISQM
jgi:hypothetical protein